MKLWTTIHDDPSMQRLSPQAFRTYINALSWAGKHESGGTWERLSRESRATKELVEAGKFHRVEGQPHVYLIHGWEGRQSTRLTQQERTDRAKRAADARWDYSRDAPAMLRSTAVVMPEKRREEKTREEQLPSAPAVRYSVDFERFWTAYPLKRDKGHAFVAFKSALRRATVDELIAGAERYAADPSRDPSKTKYAQGWLSGDRWLDEASPTNDDAVLAYIERTGG